MAEAYYDPEKTHVSTLEKVTFSSGWMFQGVLSMVAMSFLAMYYNQVFGMDLKRVQAALAIGTIADAFSDPIMAWISDSTRSRWGRRKPYIAIGGILWAATLYVIFNPPHFLIATELRAFVFLALMKVAETTWITMFGVPYTAFGADITPNADERVSVAAMRNWFAAAGKTLGPLIAKPLVTGANFTTLYPASIGYIGLVVAVVLLAPATFCKERIHAPAKRLGGPPWHAAWRRVFTDLALTLLFLGIMAGLWVLVAGLYCKEGVPLAGQRIGQGWALTAGLLMLLLFMGFFLVEGKKKRVPGIENWILVLSNKPFVILSAAHIITTVGLFTASGLLPWVAQFYLGGREAWGDIMALAFGLPLVAIPVWRYISRYIGLKNSYILMTACMLVCFVSTKWLLKPTVDGQPWVLLDFALRLPFTQDPFQLKYSIRFGLPTLFWSACLGFCNGGLMMLLPAIMPDVVDYDTLRCGQKRAGIFFAVESFAIKLAGAPTQIIAAFLVTMSGVLGADPTKAKAPNYIPPPGTADRLLNCYLVIPAALCLVALIIYFWYPLTPERARDVRRQLAERDKAEREALGSSNDTAA